MGSPSTEDILGTYTDNLRGIDAHAEVYAKVEESGRVHFYTVLFEELRADHPIFLAEQEVLRQYGPDFVDFDIFQSFSPIKSEQSSLQLIFSA